jgi:hypothetical protein
MYKIPKVNKLQKQYGLINAKGIKVLDAGRSTQKNHKYFITILYKGQTKTIHWGDKSYEHFYDKWHTYANLNHNDMRRRTNYLARSSATMNRGGYRFINDPLSPTYYAARVLW